LAQFGLPPPTNWAPRYNIAPSQMILVLRPAGAGQGEISTAAPSTPGGPAAELLSMRWGFLPAWAPEGTGAMINARAETAADKPTFRDAFRRRRCLIPADGFYEWAKSSRRKEPHWIHLRDEPPFAFAGLWERWHDFDTCAILTTAANPLLAPFHDRMPVILTESASPQWLDPETEPPALRGLMQSYPAEQMQERAVGPRVNSVAHDDERCLAPAVIERQLF
jgi:putative SOS response-associated peptidase YedK